MNRNIHLANRLREVLLSGHWIANTNYMEQLLSTSWQEANQKIQSLNTIAALTFHINYYLEGLLQVFNGGELEIKDKFSFDAPIISAEADWQKRIDNFIENSEKFIAAVQGMEERFFDQPFVKEQYGNYLQNIEGVIEHCYYHLGQITLIKKMLQ